MRGFQNIPLDIPTGIVTDTSRYDARGRYIQAENVRFWKGRPELIGGWSKITTAQTDYPARGILGWRTLDGTRYLGLGTAESLYVLKSGTLYDISPGGLSTGLEDSVSISPTSWGENTWGEGPWGGTGSSLLFPANDARVWDLAQWGEDLLAMARDEGTAYVWDSSVGTGTVAATMSNAPTGALGMFVSKEDRHVVILGKTGDPMIVQWCDQGDYTVWTPKSTNTAGTFYLDDGNVIVGHASTRLGHLIFTDTAVYLMRFVGPPYTFSITRVQSGCGLFAPHAVATLNDVTYWMGVHNFFMYDGSVRRLECPVHRDVYDNLNRVQGIKIWAGANTAFNEIRWDYPSSTDENDAVVIFSAEGWSTGTYARSCWTDQNAFRQFPVAAGTDNHVYLHENGSDAAGTPIAHQFEVSDVELGEGDTGVHIRKIIPDYDRITGTQTINLDVRGYPARATVTKGPYSVSGTTEKLSVRARGRTVGFRVSGEGDFRFGRFRLQVRPAGMRE